MGTNRVVGELFSRRGKMKKKLIGVFGIAVCAIVVLAGCGHTAKNAVTGGTLKYNYAAHSKLQGEERKKAADQIIKSEYVGNNYYPTLDTVLLPPSGSLNKVGLVIFDANIMNTGGGKSPVCCANLAPLQGVQQILSERMLDSWKKALAKYAVSGITLVPLEQITQSAAYQKEGKPVKDYPNDKELSFFQKMDKALGFENVKYSFVAVPGGALSPKTGYAVPRGLRSFENFAGVPGGLAYMNGGAIGTTSKVFEDNGLDAAIVVHSAFNWATDRSQMMSNNLKGNANMTISASLVVPHGKYEQAFKAKNLKTYGVDVSPLFRKYTIAFEDKVIVPYDSAAQHEFAKCCRDGMGAEAERDLFAPMLAEYDQAVDMLVEKMVDDLRSTQKVPAK